MLGVKVNAYVANVARMVAGPINGSCLDLMRLDIGVYTVFYRCI